MVAIAIASVASFLAGTWWAGGGTPSVGALAGNAIAAPETAPGPKSAPPTVSVVDLSETQLKSVKVEVAAERDFPVERSAVGSIDFNEELLTLVFAPYQGRIVETSGAASGQSV